MKTGEYQLAYVIIYIRIFGYKSFSYYWVTWSIVPCSIDQPLNFSYIMIY